MKRILFGLFTALVVAVSVVGCKKPMSDEDKAKLTVEKFVEYVQNNKLDSINEVYPKCTFANNLNFNTVSIAGVSKSQYFNNTYIVVCNNTANDENGKLENYAIKFTVNTVANKNKNLQRIESSEGLIQLPPALKVFLTKTGAITNGMGDADIIDNFSAFTDFVDYYIKKTNMSIEELAQQDYSIQDYSWYLHTEARLKRFGLQE